MKTNRSIIVIITVLFVLSIIALFFLYKDKQSGYEEYIDNGTNDISDKDRMDLYESKYMYLFEEERDRFISSGVSEEFLNEPYISFTTGYGFTSIINNEDGTITMVIVNVMDGGSTLDIRVTTN